MCQFSVCLSCHRERWPAPMPMPAPSQTGKARRLKRRAERTTPAARPVPVFTRPFESARSVCVVVVVYEYQLAASLPAQLPARLPLPCGRGYPPSCRVWAWMPLRACSYYVAKMGCYGPYLSSGADGEVRRRREGCLLSSRRGSKLIWLLLRPTHRHAHHTHI